MTSSFYKLSADAKEFIPASHRPAPINTIPASPSVRSQGSDYVIALFHSYVEELMLEPGVYDFTITELEQNLVHHVHDETTAVRLAEELIQLSIKESNFRYTGARLSEVLNRCLSAVNFKAHFLKRCNVEFNKKKDLITTKEGKKHLFGFALFTGELLLNLQQKEGGAMVIFREAIFKLLALFMSAPDDDSVHCISQLLKLTGGELEPQGRRCSELNSLFDEIKNFIVSPKSSANNRRILLNLIELRAKNWERVSRS